MSQAGPSCALRNLGLLTLGLTLSNPACAPPDGSYSEGEYGPNGEEAPEFAEKAGGSDIVGKVYTGYQGWFAAPGDGSPTSKWRHWAAGTTPSPGNLTFELWPDVREFSTTFQTGYRNLGNGQPARLFSSQTDSTVDTQVRWMKTYGIDGSAVQRFGSELGDSSAKARRDNFANRVRRASESHGRKFYIMYDVSRWSNFQSQIKSDWTNTIVNGLKLTSSSAYARHNGKPVVNIWGFGFKDRPGDRSQCLEVIAWFQAQGCYVIGGVPSAWRTSDGDSKSGFSDVYAKFNMISPWLVGRFRGVSGVDSWRSKLAQDWSTCKGRGQDYQPVTFPGFAWSNWNGGARNHIPRLHGEFMWRQFANIRDVGIPSAYVAMFDEFDEGTAISKAAENSSMVPTNQYFLTLDADGTKVSSDFYLRLVGDANKMLRKERALAWNHPTPHFPGSSPAPGSEPPTPPPGSEPPPLSGLPSCASRGATAATNAQLNVGDCLKSADGRFVAMLQGDGNFVLYMAGRGALWSTGTTGTGANRLNVQGDGNTVLYASLAAKWSSRTGGRGASTLTMGNDGNLALRTATGAVTWTSNTCCR